VNTKQLGVESPGQFHRAGERAAIALTARKRRHDPRPIHNGLQCVGGRDVPFSALAWH
jgi:hypothetical protein